MRAAKGSGDHNEARRIGTFDPSNYGVPAPGNVFRFSAGVLGYTVAGSANAESPRFISFVETIRDLKATNRIPQIPTSISLTDFYDSNIAHEVLHALTLIHDGAIMCFNLKNDVNGPVGFRITVRQIKQLREIRQPKWNSSEVNVPCGGANTAPNCCP